MPDGRKKILVSPLDWGLGHAARCVPIIRELLKNNTEVIIAAAGISLSFLQREFPQLKTVILPGYNITYPSEHERMVIKMAGQIPKILKGIKEEHRWLQKFISEKKIDGIISDQRFGLNSDLAPCVFITHQVMVKSPFLEGILHDLNSSYVNRFSECWIPDVAGKKNLSGDLSHKFPLPPKAKFIGPLSRFSDYEKGNISSYNVMAVVSGPEPQRTVFEKILINQLSSSGLKALLVRGLAGEKSTFNAGNTEVHSHLETPEMADKMQRSEIIISRSGYSTIMDLALLGKKAILIPTPGQTEQEYLGNFHNHRKHFLSVNQKNFDLKKALSQNTEYSGISMKDYFNDYKIFVRNFIQSL